MGKDLTKIRILLFGGSLTHAYLIRQITPSARKRLEFTLLTSHSPIYAPELFGGFLEGSYRLREIGLNLQQLCWYRNIHFIEGRGEGIDLEQKQLLLEDGQRISYDLLSLDLERSGQAIEGVPQYAVSICDGVQINKVKQDLTSRLIDPRITIVGAGALGVETALTLKQLLHENHSRAKITMIDAAQSIVPGYDLKFKELLLHELKQQQVELLLGRRIVRITDNLLVFQDNTILDYGYLIWTVKPGINPIANNSGLMVDDKGRLRLNRYLQALGHPEVFGGGDNIIIEDAELPEHIPQYSTQARFIIGNIKRLLRNKDLVTFRPNTKKTKTIHIGNQRAVIQHGIRVLKGKHVWRKKIKEDQKLIRYFKCSR